MSVGAEKALIEALRLKQLCGPFPGLDRTGISTKTATTEILHTPNSPTALNVFVSMYGDDANPGTLVEKPLRTLHRARDKLRELRRQLQVVQTQQQQPQAYVYIRGGKVQRMSNFTTITISLPPLLPPTTTTLVLLGENP